MKWLVFTVCLFTSLLSAAKESPEMTGKKGYVEPFRVFDNIFYVGDKWVSAFLIKTEMGLILIDTLEFPYSKWIPSNIRKLGFDVKDIKFILITHGHSDHVGGAGFLQGLSEAKVVISSMDERLMLEQSRKNEFPLAEVSFYSEYSHVVELGGREIKAHKTPGHTAGCTSLEFTVYDRSKPLRAFVVCGNSVNAKRLDFIQDYNHSVKYIGDISREKPFVSVNLSSHPHLGQLLERYELQKEQGNVNPFVDPQGFAKFVDLLESRGRKKLLEFQARKEEKSMAE